MALAPGTRFGPYEIESAIGSGGMGEVYKAHDTRLGRDVAIKILAPALAADDHALARFEREARAVAALNHPNILSLFDIGREAGVAYVVTELLEGQTLRERLTAGPLSARTGLEYARQIADALAAAHDRGIVHRDLKPENIFVTADGRLKVLDFGLAQMAAPAADSRNDGQTKLAATTPGLVLGTVGYMAPEQVRGQAADSRTDIFAFGLVLYEMLTGVRAFAGDTPADTMSAVLNLDPPDCSRSGVMVSPAVERIVRRCLEKSPAQRFQSARDLSFAIEAIALGQRSSGAEAAVAPKRAGSRWLVFAALAVVAIMAIAAAYFAGQRSAPIGGATGPAARFLIPSAVVTGIPTVVISPDARYVAYSSPASGAALNAGAALWLRPMDSVTATQLDPENNAGTLAVWSADGRRIATVNNADVYIADVPRGSPRRVFTMPEPVRRIAWGSHGFLISTSSGLYRVPEDGSNPQAILKIDAARETLITAPSFLPDDRILYSVIMKGDAPCETRVATLDGKVIGTVATGKIGVFYADGHLVYGVDGDLRAQPFDAAALKTTGAEFELAKAVIQDARNNILMASASANGTLVYRPAPSLDVRFTWVDRAGRVLSTIPTIDAFTNFNVSPDGTRIATTRRDPITALSALWVIDAARGVASLAAPKGDDGYGDPTWMPDGQSLLYRYRTQLVERGANGGTPRVLQAVAGYPDSVTADGRYAIYGAQNRGNYELYALDIVTPGAKPIPLVTGLTLVDEGKFSPNGKWIAYHANGNGAVQVSVMPFPPTGEKWQISETGGVQPRWSKDGQELFYLDLEGRVIRVRIPDSDPRRASRGEVLFNTGLSPSGSLDQFEPVGDRFLLRVPNVSSAVASPIGVIVNWTKIGK